LDVTMVIFIFQFFTPKSWRRNNKQTSERRL
jgi:hypothetical protein